MLGEYGRSVMRMQVRQSTPSLFGVRMSTFATKSTQLDNYAKDAPVSAAMFAEFMHKCGVPKTRLHQDLYPLEFGTSQLIFSYCRIFICLFICIFSKYVTCGTITTGQSAWPGTFPIAVAASGGADSMALMLLLREYLQENHIETPLLAVTVDHQLRPESSREALEVANICADRGGIRHITKVCEWECEEKTKQQPGEEPAASLQRPVKPRASKMEEHARQYRYDLLRQVCLEYHVRCLFVAHNRGDQLETTLFRLGRASGINGLAGIASQLPLFSVDRLLCHPLGCEASTTSNMTTIVRPLLSVTKDQLMATCDRLEQKWTHDPSNDDPTYDRVRIRQVRFHALDVCSFCADKVFYHTRCRRSSESKRRNEELLSWT